MKRNKPSVTHVLISTTLICTVGLIIACTSNPPTPLPPYAKLASYLTATPSVASENEFNVISTYNK